MTNLGGNEVRHQERRSAWCGVRGGQGECWWWWRSAEWNWGAKIQAKERRRGLRSAYPAEQPFHAEQRWQGREITSLEWNRGAPIRGRGGDRGAPILEEERREKRQYGVLNEISKRYSRLRSADGNWGAPIIVEEHHWGGGGYEAAPPCVIVMSAMASAVIQSITVEGQNLPRHSPWELITVTLFPVAYSDSAQWIAAATSASVCGVRGWKNCDVVGCRPKLLAVKNNRW